MDANAILTTEIEGGHEAAPAFAQRCANAKFVEFQARAEECRGLDKVVIEKLRIVNQTTGASQTAWEDILPDLDNEQRLRSRRGKYQSLAEEAGLEPFGDWWERSCSENGIKIPLRTAQHHLKKYRDRDRKELKPKPRAGRSLPRKQQKRMLLAGILGHDLADAAREINAFTVETAVRAFEQGAPSREEMQNQLDLLSEVEAADTGPRTALPESSRSGQLASVQCGNVADLYKKIEEFFGPDLDSCFKGLSAEQIAQAATYLGANFMRCHGYHVKGDGKYGGGFSYTAPRPRFRRQWKPKKEHVN